MEKRETRKDLRHDRYTVSLLTDHMVFAPKYRGKILTGDIAMITEGILCNIAKRPKGRTSRVLRKEFPHLKEFCDDHLWVPSCYHGSVGNGWDVVEKYISGQDTHHAKSDTYRPRS